MNKPLALLTKVIDRAASAKRQWKVWRYADRDDVNKRRSYEKDGKAYQMKILPKQDRHPCTMLHQASQGLLGVRRTHFFYKVSRPCHWPHFCF